MTRRSLKDIDALMGTKRVAKAKSMARKKMKRMFLREVRKQLGLTQAKVAKAMGDLCLIRSMNGKEGQHPRATFLMHTGYLPSPAVRAAVCSRRSRP